MQWTIRLGVVAAVLITGLLASGAKAVIQADHPAAFLRLPAQHTNSIFTGDSFALLMWIHPLDDAPFDRNIITVEHVFDIRLEPGGIVRAQLSHQPDQPPLSITLQSPIGAKQWTLISFVYSPTDCALSLSAVAPSGRHTSELVHHCEPVDFQCAGELIFGATEDGLAAFRGAYGPTVFLRSPPSATDVRSAAGARTIDSIWQTVETATLADQGVSSNVLLLLHHGLVVHPPSGGVISQSPHVIDHPVPPTEYILYDSTQIDSILSCYGAEVFGFRYVSPFEPPYDGFFRRRSIFERESHFLAAYSPRARTLARCNPTQPLRVMVSSNSRAVRRTEQLGASPANQIGPPSTGNYAGGFWEELESITSGVMLVPADASRHPLFGFSTFEQPARSTGAIYQIQGNQYPFHDFSRFWTGSAKNDSRAAGSGVLLAPGATLALKCQPRGLILPTEPLIVQTHVMKFPGASPLTWRSAREEAQSGGQQILGSSPGKSLFEIQLDTTRIIKPFTAQDRLLNETTLLLTGNLLASISVGDACVLPSAGFGCAITVVKFVSLENGKTRVELHHPLGAAPRTGQILRFGPWSHETLTYQWPGLPEDELKVWRGLQLEAGSAGLGAVAFAFSAWRPNVPGIIWGFSGWSGNGYDDQIDASPQAAITSWMRQADADIWIVVPAQQRATPQSLDRLSDLIKNARPDTEIIWAGECGHGTQVGLTNDFREWHEYIFQHAAARGFPAISLAGDTDIGSFADQIADGLRIDAAHISAKGNRLLARKWLALLRAATSLAGDADSDDALTVRDLTYIVFRLGRIAPDDEGADVDGSGLVDVNDLIFVIFRLG